MFNSMLDTAAMTFSDKLTLGGQVTLLGIGTVFTILALIWGMVELLHLVLGPKPAKKVVIERKVKEEAITSAPEIPSSDVAPAVTNGLDIIAVITAAIAAASGSSPSSFRVVSFKRANNRFSNGK